jgi:periplasmic divalent cation tolerance protein
MSGRWAGLGYEHPYEVPGVSTRPIIDGNPDYLAWIAKETDTASAQ